MKTYLWKKYLFSVETAKDPKEQIWGITDKHNNRILYLFSLQKHVSPDNITIFCLLIGRYQFVYGKL